MNFSTPNIFLAVALGLFSNLSWACGCVANTDLARMYHKTDAIFSAEVAGVTSASDRDPLEVTLVSVESYKLDPIDKTAVVYTHPQESACGYPFRVGKKYLIFANKAKDNTTYAKANQLQVSLCSNTVVLEENNRLNSSTRSIVLLESMQRFKANPPSITEHPCAALDCPFTNAIIEKSEYAASLASTDPLTALKWASDIPDSCVRAFAQNHMLKVWAKENPQEMLNKLDGRFESSMLCSKYDDNPQFGEIGGNVIEQALDQMEGLEAVNWVLHNNIVKNANGDDVLPQYFSNWLREDTLTAIDWYLLNTEKIDKKSLLHEDSLYKIKPELFLSIFEALPADEKHWLAITTVANFELHRNESAELFIATIKDTSAFEWARLTADAISGKIKPEVLLDKTATSFVSKSTSNKLDGISRPWPVYRVVEFVSWERVPNSVLDWIKTTPHLRDVIKDDIRAMLASRQRMFNQQEANDR